MKTRYNRTWYRPREIARLGLIKNSVNSDNEYSNYLYILGLIRSGRLRAKNYSKGSKMNYWLVPEDEIARYHDTVTKIGGDDA